MNILKNRHVLVASLVAPVLAILAYFAMDYLFSDPPQAAVEGQSYPLVEKPNCRYDSGYCGLKNNDFELEMSYSRLGGERLLLKLESVFPLEGVMAAVVQSETEEPLPLPMKAETGDGRAWRMELMVSEPETDRIRVVASAGGALYFGDVSTRFTLADRRPD
ncbi:MAG: hypothetical protein V2I48_02000 [Xanthomonadales bacterium]|nr:hypothetical protein [Xanthomonadales bacterium]